MTETAGVTYIDWFQHDADGRIHMCGYSEDVPTAYDPAWTVREGKAVLEQYYNAALDLVADRPTVTTPTASYDLTQLPSGTVVTVTDESGTVYAITDLSDTLTLEGPQTYRVQVDPPFPYIAVDTTVEVA